MPHLTKLSDAELQAFWQDCRDKLDELFERAQYKPGVQEEMRQLMASGDTLQAFRQIGLSNPEVSDIVKWWSFAGLLKLQFIEAIEAEQTRRSKLN